ncbi:MAG: CDP-alcohol phosphatidyltransferase family protein [Planctomycetota bacterium]|jgi:CDP-diacylglycerol--glycerol-3-phosphate 3-phosphatidyltransferase
MLARQVPNLVTGARLFLAVGAFWFMGRVIDADGDMESAGPAAFWAFWLFLVAAITDFVDGHLARRNNWVTALGRVADPVVDKVLILGSLTYLAAGPTQFAHPDDLSVVMPVWAVVLMLGREFLVTALRGLIESRGMEFPADRFGKLKLIVQVVYIAIALGILGGIPDWLHFPFLGHVRDGWFFAGVFWLMIGLTLFSGLNYCRRGIQMLNGGEGASQS